MYAVLNIFYFGIFTGRLQRVTTTAPSLSSQALGVLSGMGVTVVHNIDVILYNI
jgi:hypothetical protein